MASKNRIRRTVCWTSLLLVCLVFAACEGVLVGNEPDNTPEANFDLLWSEFDALYGQFVVKNIDWEARYAEYRPQVTPAMREDDLWRVTTAMLRHLNDNHVTLHSPSLNRWFNAGILNDLVMKDFDLNLVKQTYLTGARTAGEGRFTYGTLVGNVGYVHIRDFLGEDGGTSSPWAEEIDTVLNGLAQTRAFIVDIRGNHGGADVNAQRIASAFADQRRLFMTSQTRNGPLHSDFDAPRSWHLTPGTAPFSRPVVLLAHRHTVSSAEVFALAMRTLPHVVQVGDTTSGAFSNTTFERQLPNGWAYRLSHQLFLSAEGKSYEGVGLAPAILVRNTKTDIESGQDVALERALNSLDGR